MKKIVFTLIALFMLTVNASAMSYEQAREQALFLTDKMAYELNLTEDQYEAAYEINLDYLMNVNTVDDLYGAYWRYRNLDLSYILLDWQYRAFCDAAYFYRPIYWDGGFWHFGIYARYPHRDYFYFGRPSFYAVYHGGHSWRMNGGHSWYRDRHDWGRPGNRPAVGMRDGFQRGDYRNGFDNNRNRTFGNLNNRGGNGISNGNGGNRSFGNGNGNGGNRPSTGNNNGGNGNGNGGTVTRRRGTFGSGARAGSIGTTQQPRNMNMNQQNAVGTPQRQSTRSFGGSTRSTGTTQQRSTGSFGGSTRSTGSFGGSTRNYRTTPQSSTRTTVTRTTTPQRSSSFGSSTRSMNRGSFERTTSAPSRSVSSPSRSSSSSRSFSSGSSSRSFGGSSRSVGSAGGSHGSFGGHR